MTRESPERSAGREAVRNFFLLTVPTLVLMGAFAVLVWQWTELRRLDGIELNRHAWEATYTERGLEVPPGGPREGYWGHRLRPGVPDEASGWRPHPVRLEGLVEIDDDGRQHYRSGVEDARRVVIAGGSTSAGVYASAAHRTYWHLLGEGLARRSLPTDVTIVAAGGWKSRQSLPALRRYLEEAPSPDLVIALDGLNDLTSGAASRTLFGEEVATRDGSPWTPEYHAHDYEERVRDYLVNVETTWRLARSHGSDLLVVLQPSLAERRRLSRIERRVLQASLRHHASREALRRSYAAMRRGLEELSRREGLHFLDASRIFHQQEATTFADLWHLSDPGQEILARVMTERVARLLADESPDQSPDQPAGTG